MLGQLNWPLLPSRARLDVLKTRLALGCQICNIFCSWPMVKFIHEDALPSPVIHVIRDLSHPVSKPGFQNFVSALHSILYIENPLEVKFFLVVL